MTTRRGNTDLHPVPIGGYKNVYVADETMTAYTVTDDELEELERMERDDPIDGYSLWCGLYGHEATLGDIRAAIAQLADDLGMVPELWQRVLLRKEGEEK